MAKLSYIIKQLEIREEKIWEKEGGKCYKSKAGKHVFCGKFEDASP